VRLYRGGTVGRYPDGPAYIDRENALPKQNTDGLDIDAERAVVARLLEDTSELVTRDQLHAATPQLTPERRDAAVVSLRRARVLWVERDGLRATEPLQRLNALQMIAF